MMNGDLVDGKAKEELLNASAQIAMFAPDDAAAVETAYLCVLTRRPTPKRTRPLRRRSSPAPPATTANAALADLYWVLFNGTEMSFNH